MTNIREQIIFAQKEVDGVFTVSIQTTLKDITFGNKGELTMNKESNLPYSQSEIDNCISNTIEDFIKRYNKEQKRLNEKYK